jgi:uncharacterized damage-inducible protein DinB
MTKSKQINSSTQLAKHFREFYFGGNWTFSNLRNQLSDVSWEQAIIPVDGLNTIATLANHIHYYVRVQIPVLKGGKLDAKDELSFAHAPINSAEDWQNIQDSMWKEAEEYAQLLESLPEQRLWDILEEEKYGIYYRNLLGLIEHGHYHLGQIALIKKLLVRT